MAKLFFRYGSMASGKSAHLLITNFNYTEIHKKTLIFTPAKDNRYGKNIIKSRVGLEAEAIPVSDETNIFDIVKKHQDNIFEQKVSCVLIDEVQFLKKEHIHQLADIVDILDIPVIAYGLRTNFKLEPFEGSSHIMALADQVEELKTLCHNCNKKAVLNIKYKKKDFLVGWYKDIVTEGEEIEIGGNDNYVPLCRKCYKELLKTSKLVRVKDTSIIPKDTVYCYSYDENNKFKYCPYMDRSIKKNNQESGYCHFLETGDWVLNDEMVMCDGKTGEKMTPHEIGIPGGLLWDDCKECGVNFPPDFER